MEIKRNTSKREGFLRRFRTRKPQSVSEILTETAKADELAVQRRAEHTKQRAQLDALLEQGLSVVEASKLLLARSRPAVTPAAVKPVVAAPVVKPYVAPVILPAPVAAAPVAAPVAQPAGLSDAVVTALSRIAFNRAHTRAELQQKLFAHSIEIPGLSVSESEGAAKGWKRWTLKGRERASSLTTQQVLLSELERLQPDSEPKVSAAPKLTVSAPATPPKSELFGRARVAAAWCAKYDK